LVIPGGVKAMEKMRQSEAAIHIVRSLHSGDCVIASMCSGAQLLISAGIVKGKRISAYYAMRVDVENAGAEFVDAPAVVCDRIVSSPHYKHLGPWMQAALAEVSRIAGMIDFKTVPQPFEGAACAAAL
jgi:protease I